MPEDSQPGDIIFRNMERPTKEEFGNDYPAEHLNELRESYEVIDEPDFKRSAPLDDWPVGGEADLVISANDWPVVKVFMHDGTKATEIEKSGEIYYTKENNTVIIHNVKRELFTGDWLYFIVVGLR